MIDLHSHILTGIDDGAESEQDMLAMCRLCSDDGVTVVIATPHALDGKYASEPDDVIRRVGTLNDAVRAMGLDLKILPGMEVRIVADLLEHLNEGRVLTINQGKYVLVEFHPSHIPNGFDNLLKGLIDHGFGVIIAHPEKNLRIQREPEYVYRLIQAFPPWRFLVQITAESVCGTAGYRAGKTAKVLLQHGLVHVIATDAHSSRSRIPQLSPAVKAAARLIGEDSALKMVTQIPLAVLGEGDFPDGWNPSNPRRWWRIL